MLDQTAAKLGITGKGMVRVQRMGGIGKTVLAAALASDEEMWGEVGPLGAIGRQERSSGPCAPER